MPTTAFLAKLIGRLLLLYALAMALNKRAMLAAIVDLVRSPALMLFGASFNLVIGLAIVLGRNLWSGGALTIVVTSIGWLVPLRGIA